MFGRLLTAMVTPFDEQGNLDLSCLPMLIDHLLTNGTEGLVVCGTTGESPTLTHEEKMELFSKTVEYVHGKVPIIAGTGGYDTKSAVNFTREVDQLGVDGFLQVTPFYNKPSQEGLYRHFKEIAEATDKPVIIYNIPGRTAVNVQVDTMVRLAKIPNIVAVKESSGDFAQISRMISETPDDFMVYSGDDKYALPIMALGGTGVVSVAAHVVGKAMGEMVAAFFSGDLHLAQVLHHQLFPVFEGLFRTTNPVLVKEALGLIGIPVGSVRLPLVPATLPEKQAIMADLARWIPEIHAKLI